MENQSQNPANIGVLIVDDDPVILDGLSGYLRLEDWRVECAQSANEALAVLREQEFAFVITDISMKGLSGIDLLQRIRVQHPDVEVIIMTGIGTEDFAIQALRAGAVDYFHKPIRGPEVSASLMRSLRVLELKSRNTQLNALVSRYSHHRSMPRSLGQSPAAANLQEQLLKVAAISDATLLLTGESGSGKEVAARMVHQASRPEDAPFVAINCGGISESLLERELFGHEKGAFTGADKRAPGVFEMAIGGTVMLDEISEMSAGGQASLLRVLDERSFRRVGGEVEVQLGGTRVIAAANKDLEQLVRANLFREDLYFRLNVVPVNVPALRERKVDILPLAEQFLRATSNGSALSLTPETRRMLETYDYPGNIRELKNIMEHAAIFCGDGIIRPADLSFSKLGGQQIPAGETDGSGDATPLSLAESEKRLIQQALEQAANHSAAARSLGITPQALYRRMEKFDLS